MSKGHWLNNKTVRHPELEKPCVKLNYCPFGQLVEEFPITDPRTKLSCVYENNNNFWQWGHDCPVHYLSELVD